MAGGDENGRLVNPSSTQPARRPLRVEGLNRERVSLVRLTL